VTIRVLVVEDDTMLAAAHQELAGRVPGFEVVGVAHSGGEALRFLAARPVDLILLDVYLPDMTGLEVCRAVRAQGRSTDVIAVTSARDLEVVRAAVTQGVVAYLLKPFTFASLRDKLLQYAEYRRQVTAGEPTRVAAQHDVDRVLATLRAPGRPAQPTQVADDIGVSRVTARRYLEHLATQRLASRSPRYGGTAGRPEYRYRWRT
jgi:response regulator of citrate/malate metabolism